MTEPQGREAIPQIAAILKEIDICQFATRGESGQLHARPMSNNSEVEFDGDSWFFAPSDGRLVAELRRDPSAVTSGTRGGPRCDRGRALSGDRPRRGPSGSGSCSTAWREAC